MADVGSSKLACVNRILQQADMLPVSSLDTGGNSDAGRAELVLDNKSIEVQAQGLRENTYTDTLTANGSGNVSLPGTVLDVRGSHEHAHRNFRTDGDQLYDIDNNTNNFGAGATVYVEIVYQIEFVKLSQQSKNYITAAAAREFAQWRRPDPLKDSWGQEYVAEVSDNFKSTEEKHGERGRITSQRPTFQSRPNN